MSDNIEYRKPKTASLVSSSPANDIWSLFEEYEGSMIVVPALIVGVFETENGTKFACPSSEGVSPDENLQNHRGSYRSSEPPVEGQLDRSRYMLGAEERMAPESWFKGDSR